MYSLEVKNYKELLTECFKSDSDLLEKWHIEAGSGLDNCVNRTFNDLQTYNVKIFGLYEENKLIGYFGQENQIYLTGFFIKPQYRNSKNIKQFWNLINNEFKGPYIYCGIYKKNEPAFNFLSKNNGMLIMNNENYVFFMFYRTEME